MKHAAGEWTRLEDAPWAKDGRRVLGWWKKSGAIIARSEYSEHERRDVWKLAQGVYGLIDPDYVAEIHPPEVGE